MSQVKLDIDGYVLLDHESLGFPGSHARALQLFRDSVVRPSLHELDREIEENARSDDPASVFYESDLADLFQTSIESYLLAVQSMWERGLRKLLISREKSLLGKDGVSALQRATWSSGTRSLQFHFERLIGFPMTVFGAYEDLDLLQNLGNAIRHGDGPSAERVHKLAPSLWWNWIAPNETLQAGPFTVEASDSAPKHPSFDAISLGKSVLEQMMQAVCEFWQDLEYMRCNSFRNKHESTLRQMSAWAEERRCRRKMRVWTAR
ncbi:hypothetical protein [Massilia timonae]|uniref:hypothetical protein n=1 Tax=Massilia timonae TaxID=47229 RepID=UPI0028D35978|nr:hypothetical protein [Massilia timonae]